MYRYFKQTASDGSGNYVYYWKSKGWSDERINSIKTPNHDITRKLDSYGNKTRLEFNGSCLKQDSVTFNYGKVVNIYVAYDIRKGFSISDYPTLENCLFGDIDKYKYSGYRIGFDRHGSFSFGNGVGRNVVIFGVDMNSSTKNDNRKKDILIIGKGPALRLEDTLTAGKVYSINFAE